MKTQAIISVFFGVVVVAALSAVWTDTSRTAQAHCQVPCGIYDDPARINYLKEDAATIAKATAQINSLAGQHGALAVNQSARWVMTKENHASHVITVMAEYFLAQRVKPVAPGTDGHDDYLKKLAEHHSVIVAAMKTKQSADPATVEALNKAIDAIAPYYHKH
ncbi:MAG: superoxide dismutase [Ni] [Phycisphaerae bacterium]